MTGRSGQRSCAAGPRYTVKRRGIRRQAATWRIASWRSWRASSSGARRGDRSIGLTPPLAPTSAASVRAPAPLGPRREHLPRLPQSPRFARHDGGANEPRRAGIDLGPLVEQLLDLRRHAARSKNSTCGSRYGAPDPLHWRPAAAGIAFSRGRSLPGRPQHCLTSRLSRDTAGRLSFIAAHQARPRCAGSSARPARREQIVAGPARGYTEAARSITARGAPVKTLTPAERARRAAALGIVLPTPFRAAAASQRQPQGRQAHRIANPAHQAWIAEGSARSTARDAEFRRAARTETAKTLRRAL